MCFVKPPCRISIDVNQDLKFLFYGMLLSWINADCWNKYGNYKVRMRILVKGILNLNVFLYGKSVALKEMYFLHIYDTSLKDCFLSNIMLCIISLVLFLIIKVSRIFLHVCALPVSLRDLQLFVLEISFNR